MIFDCEVAIVVSTAAHGLRFSRARVGLATDNSGTPVVVVITSQSKDKFKIVDNCRVGSTTVSFDSPKKDLYFRNCDQLLLKSFMALITKINKKELLPKLANIRTVERLKPKQTSLTIKDNNYNSNDLLNKCLQKLFCENMTSIPELVWKQNNLYELKLINCHLNEIPIELQDLGPNLKVLDLSKNNIKSIDGSFVLAMNKLKTLDLNHNKLDFIPFEFKLMRSLERLNLSYNQLNHLPNTLGTISALQCLDLSHNNFNCLPFSLIKQFLLNVRFNNFDISANPLREPIFKYSLKAKKPFPTLQSLSSAAILSTDSLLYSCHQYLPKIVYKYIQMNGENCCVCSNFVGNKDMRLPLIYQSLDQISNCLSTSHFPSFPLFPSIRYTCYLCFNSLINKKNS